MTKLLNACKNFIGSLAETLGEFKKYKAGKVK